MTAPPAVLADLLAPAALALGAVPLGADAALAQAERQRAPHAARRGAEPALARAAWVLLAGACLLLAPRLPPPPAR